MLATPFLHQKLTIELTMCFCSVILGRSNIVITDSGCEGYNVIAESSC